MSGNGGDQSHDDDLRCPACGGSGHVKDFKVWQTRQTAQVNGDSVTVLTRAAINAAMDEAETDKDFMANEKFHTGKIAGILALQRAVLVEGGASTRPLATMDLSTPIRQGEAVTASGNVGLTLSEDELYELTHYKRPAEQMRVLAEMRMPFIHRKHDNTVCVFRIHGSLPRQQGSEMTDTPQLKSARK